MDKATRQALQVIRALAGSSDGVQAIAMVADAMRGSMVPIADIPVQLRGDAIQVLIDGLFWQDMAVR